MAPLIAVVDSGPLVAAADMDDGDHDASLAALTAEGIHLVIPALVIAEATYFVGTRLGAPAEARFLKGLSTMDIEAPAPSDWDRISELVDRYRDFPLGGTDASVVALAERLGTATVLTLDRRHFSAIRPRHCDAFTLLP